jgi:hypothetical protein
MQANFHPCPKIIISGTGEKLCLACIISLCLACKISLHPYPIIIGYGWKFTPFIASSGQSQIFRISANARHVLAAENRDYANDQLIV